MIVYLCFDSVALRRIREANPTRDCWDVIGCSRPDEYITASTDELVWKFEDLEIPVGYHVGKWTFEDEDDLQEFQEMLDEHGGVFNFRIKWN